MGDAAKTAMHIKVTTIQSVFELPIAMASTPMAMASNLIAMAFNLVAASNPSKREMEREREKEIKKERKRWRSTSGCMAMHRTESDLVLEGVISRMPGDLPAASTSFQFISDDVNTVRFQKSRECSRVRGWSLVIHDFLRELQREATDSEHLWFQGKPVLFWEARDLSSLPFALPYAGGFQRRELRWRRAATS